MGDRIGSERRLVLWAFVFVAMTVVVMGTFMEQHVAVSKYGKDRSFSGDLPVQVQQTALSASSTQLKAMIKGSIYETGSNMTVFGACFDGDGYLLPEANASFTAWYPNGTIMVGPNETMFKVYDDAFGYHVNGTGRWGIHVTMGNTIGTYLTEIMCTYEGEWAIAYGEWQNPEWVERIAQTQSSVNDTYILLQNVSQNLSDFRNETANNFSQVLSAVNGINVQGDVQAQMNELSWMVQALDLNRWKLDAESPFYVLGSGSNMFKAVDMLGPDNVAIASSDGVYAKWDGETWSYVTQPTYEYRGVSVLPANQPYAWVVGTDGANAIVSINGGNGSVLGLSPSEGSAFNDVKVFQDPNDPSGAFRAYLLASNGNVYLSTDSGSSFGYVGAVGSASSGRISQVVENYGVDAQPLGYSVMIGQGTSVMVTDGVNDETYAVNGTVRDVDMLYADLGYVVVEDASDSKVYRFNGTDLILDYTINDSSVVPVSVEANARNDVWIATRDPSVFYHFDGHSWQYSTFAYSNLVSVIVSFGNASNATGLYDMVMSDSRHGYAVGDDGLVMIYNGENAQRFDDLSAQLNANTSTILSQLSAMNVTLVDIQQAQDGNFTLINQKLDALNLSLEQQYALLQNINATLDGMNTTITDMQTFLDAMNASLTSSVANVQSSVDAINSTLVAMNTSIAGDFSDLQAFLDTMNATLDYKLDNVLNNVTYTQLYLETTLFPMVNATYQNTVLILQQLGILQAAVNQTIELQNQTLQIVNQTQTDVGELVNRSRRVRAWITQ